jgi:hypothetical protein
MGVSYVYPPKTINSLTLEDEVRAAGLPVIHYGCSRDANGDVRITMERTLTAPEKTTLDTIVANHVATVQPQTILGVAGGGTGIGSYGTGDLIYASGQTVLAKLAAGAGGQRLEMLGGLPLWKGAHGARVRRTTNISIPNTTWSPCTFDLEEWDTDGYVNLGSDAYHLFTPSGLEGMYFGYMYGVWELNASGVARLGRIWTSTSGEQLLCRRAPASSLAAEAFCCGPVYLQAGEYAEVDFYHDAGGNINMRPEPNYSIVFTLVYLGKR